jgi:hypothetical protein
MNARFFTSALVGGDLSDSGTGRFTPGESILDNQWIRVWVGSRAGLDDVEKRKFLSLPGLDSDPSVVQPVTIRYTDCGLPAPIRL